MRVIKYLIITLLLTVMLLVSGLLAAPMLLSPTRYNTQIAQGMTDVFGVEPKIEGEAALSFFPQPRLELHHIWIPNISGAAKREMVMIDSLSADIAYMDLIALVSGEIKIKNLQMDGVEFELETLSDGRKNWQELTLAKWSKDSVFPQNIAFTNSKLILRSHREVRELEDVNIEVKTGDVLGELASNGTFNFANSTIQLDGSLSGINEGAKAILDLSSESFSINYEASVKDTTTMLFEGQIKGNISNMAEFFSQYSAGDSLFARVTSTEKLDFSGEMLTSKEQMDIRNLSFSSQHVEGRGDIKTSFDASAVWDINTVVQRLDIDSLTTREEAQEFVAPFSPIKLIKFNDFSFDVPGDLSLLFYFSAKEVIYRGDKISNLVVDADLFNQEIAIHTLSAQVPGKSMLEFTGTISHNDVRPLLNGSIAMSGSKLRSLVTWLDPRSKFIPENQLNSYVFKSQLEMTPRQFIVDEMSLSVDRLNAFGDISLRAESPVPVMQLKLGADYLDADKYRLRQKLAEILAQYAQDAPTWDLDAVALRLFGLKLNASLAVDRATFNGQQINGITLDMEMSPGELKVERFAFLSKKGDANAKFYVDLNEEIPQLDLVLRSNGFDTVLWREPLIGDANNGINLKPENPKSWKWDKQSFNMMGLDRFGGNFDVKLKRLVHHKLRLDNLSLVGKLNKKIITFDEARSNFYDGSIDVKGSVGVSSLNPSFGISFAASNIDMARMLHLFQDEVAVTGTFFASGTAKTVGKNPREWVTGMTSGLRFSMKDIKIRNFGLTELVERAPRLVSAIDLDRLTAQSLYKGVTEIPTMSGEVEFNKGIARLGKVRLATDLVRGAMGGVVDVRTLQAKTLSKITFSPESGKLVTLKLKTEGALLYPQPELDASELERYITEKALR